ncbi:DMT family transporter [Planococcus sp. N028]|uniref:DMT family transporter n=1 Tax=Planococcus shixiaomingii TaxID=3058393 RepID=A0ABT8N2C7_9BACL|nr:MULTISPECIES: DMT family transporter [unclassified Planococcus (in: firmicutes)]MDN7241883.1 DMT family transporter [Planococcus sp. N028]WKA54168.1 DMT family transporter [Planococcus sp. N022]
MNRFKGIAMVLSGAMLWGATGPLIEWTLGYFNLSVPFLLTLRMTIAGVLLLLFLKLKKVQLTSIFRQGIWVRQLLVFAIFGMLGCQYAFVAAIEVSNAVVATLLQFLAPVYIILVVSLGQRKWPPFYQVVGMGGTLAGLFLLLTNGQLDKLTISGIALVWGLLLGLAFAFYTLYPARLMQEWGVLLVVAWSMLIGGVFIGLVNPIFLSTEWPKIMNWPAVISILGIIVIGTLAFVLFLSSLRFITAVETSILSAFEPLTAMILSVLWFNELLAPIQLFGAFAMLVFVTWLSLAGKEKLEEEKA